MPSDDDQFFVTTVFLRIILVFCAAVKNPIYIREIVMGYISLTLILGSVATFLLETRDAEREICRVARASARDLANGVKGRFFR